MVSNAAVAHVQRKGCIAHYTNIPTTCGLLPGRHGCHGHTGVVAHVAAYHSQLPVPPWQLNDYCIQDAVQGWRSGALLSWSCASSYPGTPACFYQCCATAVSACLILPLLALLQPILLPGHLELLPARIHGAVCNMHLPAVKTACKPMRFECRGH